MIVTDKTGKLSRGQILQDIGRHVKEFEFYYRTTGETLNIVP